jgi:hypothetical protein
MKFGTASYALGGSQSILLPEVGYLARIWIFFVGSVTYSAGSTAANFAPYSLFKRITVTLNNSATDIFNASGFSTYLINQVISFYNKLDVNSQADFYAYPVSGAAQNFVLGLQIPVAMSQGMNFEAGLINLQAPEVQCQLNVDFVNALADIGDNISALSGTVHAYYEYYEVPQPTRVMQPPVMLHRWIEQTQPITGTGENIYTVPRGGQMLSLLHTVSLNGARSDSWDKMRLRFNQSEIVYDVDRRLNKIVNRERYGNNLPVGVAVWDWKYALQQAEESDLRDAINTEMVTTTDSIIDVSSGASLGSNNNYLTSVREILQSAQPV